ncbi:hypothetical protein E3N88_41636 [Mikania micrantha]|uniref:Uncharacterized protein n=1 Tax=Mikania micrantha TaxID=192012 RepID=A0A5N6LK90_9ASTR|nr:hypothetical protein E3N88_41636 [Mikania micrantha]
MKQSKEEHSVGLNFVWPMRKPTTHRVLVAAADGFLGVLFVQQKTERKGEKNFHHLQNQPRSQSVSHSFNRRIVFIFGQPLRHIHGSLSNSGFCLITSGSQIFETLFTADVLWLFPPLLSLICFHMLDVSISKLEIEFETRRNRAPVDIKRKRQVLIIWGDSRYAKRKNNTFAYAKRKNKTFTVREGFRDLPAYFVCSGDAPKPFGSSFSTILKQESIPGALGSIGGLEDLVYM